jgi:hypothetical protein
MRPVQGGHREAAGGQRGAQGGAGAGEQVQHGAVAGLRRCAHPEPAAPVRPVHCKGKLMNPTHMCSTQLAGCGLSSRSGCGFWKKQQFTAQHSRAHNIETQLSLACINIPGCHAEDAAQMAWHHGEHMYQSMRSRYNCFLPSPRRCRRSSSGWVSWRRSGAASRRRWRSSGGVWAALTPPSSRSRR